jgi:hypothetical protein
MVEVSLLESTISEYRSMLPRSRRQAKGRNADTIRDRLMSAHDWTDRGAETIVQLAHNYGAFMLRNALALAVAMEKEDGDLEF